MEKLTLLPTPLIDGFREPLGGMKWIGRRGKGKGNTEQRENREEGKKGRIAP